jgi:hypothetical protein
LNEWHLERLPGDVRREAETAAQRAGQPLHRWLAQIIRDTCATEGVAPSRELSRMPDDAASANGARTGIAVSRPTAGSTTPEGEGSTGPAVARNGAASEAAEPVPVSIIATVESRADAKRAPTRAPEAVAESEPTERLFRRRPATAPSAPQPAARVVPVPASAPAVVATTIITQSPTEPVRPRQATAAFPSPRPAPRDEKQIMLTQLVAGIQRNELSPLGEARLYLKLMTEQMASIGDITAATGRTRDQVGRTLRLLGLSDRLRELIDSGALTRAQAFALLDAGDPETMIAVVPNIGAAVTESRAS